MAAAGLWALDRHIGVCLMRSNLVMQQLGRRVLLCGHVGSATDELHGVHRGKDHGSADKHPEDVPSSVELQ